MFCGQCGAKINESSGLCPNCDAQRLHDLQAHSKKAKKKQKKAEKRRRKEERTKGKKAKRVFLKIIAFLLATLVVASAAVGALIYFDVLHIGGDDTPYDLLANAPEDLPLVDMNSAAEHETYGAIYYAPLDTGHVADDGGSQYMDNEVLVVVKDGTTTAQVETLAQGYAAQVVGAIEIAGYYQLRLQDAYTKEELQNIAASLEQEDIVSSTTLNFVQTVSYASTEERNGFYLGEKWQRSLQNFNNVRGKSWGIEAINVLDAWDLLANAANEVNPIKVGVLDSGFDVTQEDLQNVFAEVFYDNGANGVTSSGLDHGTHVAGIFTASTQDTTGICGVYPYGDKNLYAVACSNAYVYQQSIIAHLVSYAELIIRNVKVINISQGYNFYQQEGFLEWYTQIPEFEYILRDGNLLADFFQRMLDKGYDFVIVSAAGNDSAQLPSKLDARYSLPINRITREEYPEVYDRIIVVGAVDYSLEVTAYSNGGDRVDIYAPGGDSEWDNKEIYSTLPQDQYGYKSGTSMAAPHVAGVAAMVWSANNALTGAQVKEIVCRRGSMRCTSCKMVDAYAAVQIALGEDTSAAASDPQNGGILCYVVDKENENVKINGATVTVTNVETGETFSADTNTEGHFELAVPSGEYTLAVRADGYSPYVWPDGNIALQNPIVVRQGEINYLDDWIKLTKAETTLKQKLMQQTNLPILHFFCNDYDSDGSHEAFAVVGEIDNSMGENWYTQAELWFVSEADTMLLESDIYGYPNGILPGEQYDFLSLERSAGGSGSLSYVYGVRNGVPQEMNVSQNYGDFHMTEEYVYTGYVSDFSAGYHEWIYTEFLFDPSTYAFVENTAENAAKIQSGESQAVSTQRDIVLVLDISSSMSGTPIEETKTASVNFIDTVLEEDASIGLVTYNSSADMVSNFSVDETSLNTLVNSIEDSGNTNIEAGLQTAETMLSASDAETKIIVLMSDGEPNNGKVGEELIEYADDIKSQGIYIYTLGFFESMGSGKSSAQVLMEGIASPGCHYEVDAADNLVFFFGDIADQINGTKYMYIRIACPVDVTVTYDGETLTSEESDLNTRTSFGSLTFEESEDEDADADDMIKVLRLKEGMEYDIQIRGTGRGTMDYTIGFMDENGEYSDMRRFENIEITRRTKITTTAATSSETELLIDEDGDGRVDLRYRAGENGVGEIVDYTLFIYIGVGAGVLLLLLLTFLLIRRKKNRKAR